MKSFELLNSRNYIYILLVDVENKIIHPINEKKMLHKINYIYNICNMYTYRL